MSSDSEPKKRWTARVLQRFDHEDCLYVGGSIAASAGCAWIYPPSGLVCLGVFVIAWPFVARLLSKGPQQ